MRSDLASLGFVVTLLSASLAHGQVMIDVSKITCDQFAQGKVGLPRTTAIWLNGYYHGKRGSTTIDTQQSEAIFGELMDFCRTGENGKVLVMQALERLAMAEERSCARRGAADCGQHRQLPELLRSKKPYPHQHPCCGQTQDPLEGPPSLRRAIRKL